MVAPAFPTTASGLSTRGQHYASRTDRTESSKMALLFSRTVPRAAAVLPCIYVNKGGGQTGVRRLKPAPSFDHLGPQ